LKAWSKGVVRELIGILKIGLLPEGMSIQWPGVSFSACSHKVSKGTVDFAAPRPHLTDRALFCEPGKGYYTLNKREDEY
jgi:hypothetical protein